MTGRDDVSNQVEFSMEETNRILDCLAYEYRDDPDALEYIEDSRGQALTRGTLFDLEYLLFMFCVSSEQDWREGIA